MNEEKYTVRLTIIVLLFLVLSFPGKFSAVAQSVSRSFETKISFPKELNTPTINFNLQSIGNKKFKLVLDKPNAQLTNVKIFDILGNLILQDQLLPDDGLQKNYDFTQWKLVMPSTTRQKVFMPILMAQWKKRPIWMNRNTKRT